MTVPSQDKFRRETLSKLKKLLFSGVFDYRRADIIGLQYFGNSSSAGGRMKTDLTIDDMDYRKTECVLIWNIELNLLESGDDPL